MKLSIENFTIRERVGDKEGLKMIKNAGFDCVDYSYYFQPESCIALQDDYLEYAKNIRKYLDEIGLECNQAHAPFVLWYGATFNESEPHFRYVVRALESASILGAKNIVVHAIWPADIDDVNFDMEEYNFSYYKSLEPYCKKFGIRVAVENLFHWDAKRKAHFPRFGRAKDLTSFVKKLNSEYFVACVDVGHAGLTGNEPHEFISKMDKSILKCLHIQDSNFLGDCHNLPFLENYEWDKIMKSLKDIGYDGDFTFETIKFTEKFPNELLPDVLKFTEKVGRYLISLAK